MTLQLILSLFSSGNFYFYKYLLISPKFLKLQAISYNFSSYLIYICVYGPKYVPFYTYYLICSFSWQILSEDCVFCFLLPTFGFINLFYHIFVFYFVDFCSQFYYLLPLLFMIFILFFIFLKIDTKPLNFEAFFLLFMACIRKYVIMSHTSFYMFCFPYAWVLNI